MKPDRVVSSSPVGPIGTVIASALPLLAVASRFCEEETHENFAGL